MYDLGYSSFDLLKVGLTRKYKTKYCNTLTCRHEENYVYKLYYHVNHIKILCKQLCVTNVYVKIVCPFVLHAFDRIKVFTVSIVGRKYMICVTNRCLHANSKIFKYGALSNFRYL